MLRYPRVVASENSMFAPTSQSPTTASTGSDARPGRSDAPTTRAAASASSGSAASRGNRVRDALVGGTVGEHEVEAESERSRQRQAETGSPATALLTRFARCDGDADERQEDPGDLKRARSLAGRDPDRERNHRGNHGDRGDDSHRADRHPTVERRDAETAARTCSHGQRHRRPAGNAVAGRGNPDQRRGQAEDL